MSRFASTARTFSIAAAGLLSIYAASAQAQDANAVASRLKELFSQQGTEIGWTAVNGSGDTVTLESVSVGVPGQAEKFTIGAVALEGVSEANGGYRIGTMRFPDYAFEDQGMSFAMTGATISGAVIPPAGSTDPMASFLFYDAADVTSMSVKIGDKPVFSMEGAHATMTPPAADTPMTFTFDLPKMSADLASIPDLKTQELVNALGYQNVTGQVKMAGNWQLTDGRIALTQYDIIFDDAATLGMKFDLSGYTPAFIKSLQEVQKQMAADPQAANSQAQGMAMLGLMQQLTFNTAEIRVTDASLTKKVIDYVAAQQKVKPQDLVMQAKGILPFALGQLNNPELAAQVSAAVGAYLDDPKSLTISAKPAAPVPFAVLMAGGMGDPTSLPKTLNVTVTAND